MTSAIDAPPANDTATGHANFDTGQANGAGQPHVVDADRWPELATVPRARTAAFVARVLFEQAAARLPVRVRYPGSRSVGAGGPAAPVIRIVRPRAFYARLGSDGLIGFGEGWMAGDWESDDPVAALTPFAEQLGRLVPQRLQWLRRWRDRPHPNDDVNTIEGARRNIARHYDLSNDFFSLFLDETMTYSAALFDDAGRQFAGEELAVAQQRKIDRLLDLTRTGPESRVLEIGTGWGELALRAARRGARVTTITLSREQRDLALRRVAAAGVADRVQVELRDYRELTGHYDAIVSVEMIEAVGYQNWPAYFSTLDRSLAPHGRVGLQAIVMPHDRLLASRDSHTWIHKYIFPGGLLPSVAAIEETLAAHTQLRITDRFAMGDHYAETLRRWRERFLARRPQLARLGFDATFSRMWEFYLAYCEAGFRANYLDVQQLVMERSVS